MLELFHGESLEKKIPVKYTNDEAVKLDAISCIFCIYSGDKKEYEAKLEKYDEGFILELSEDDIMTFDEGMYTGELKIKTQGKTQKQRFDISIKKEEEAILMEGDDIVVNTKDKNKLEIYFQEPIDVAIDSFFSDKKNIEKFLAPFIPEDGYTPIKGVDYFDGEDGKTPKKGVDYFDGEDGVTPVKGKDYFTNKELTTIKKELKDIILAELPKYATQDDITEKINELIRRLPEGRIEKGATYLRHLLDVKMGELQNAQYGLTYNKSTSNFTLEEIVIPPESDTLQSVTDRGDTTTKDITVNSVTETVPTLLKLDQTANNQTLLANSVTITATDEIYFGDVTDSAKLKKSTVQGILDLTPAPDLSTLLKLDQTTPQTTVGTFTFPNVKVTGLTSGRVPFASTAGLLVDSSRLTFADTGLMTLTGTSATDGLSATGQLTITGIAGTTGATPSVGSVVSLTGGVGGVATAGLGANGGAVTLTSGAGSSPATTAAITQGGNGGGISFITAAGASNDKLGTSETRAGFGGALTFRTGAGGNILVAPLVGITTGAGGAVDLIAGKGGSVLDSTVSLRAGTGGSFTFSSGEGGDAMTVGTGENRSGNGGNTLITAGRGGEASGGSLNSGGTGGNVNLNAGQGGTTRTAGTSGAGGNINFRAGNSGISSSPVSNGVGGSLSFTPGVGGSVNRGGNSGSFVVNAAQGRGFSLANAVSPGGNGSSILCSAGAGGNSTSTGAELHTAGNSGVITFSTGNGGNATTGTGTNIAGSASNISFTGGNGGNATSGSTNTGGDGSSVRFRAGLGGTGSTANGANGHIIFESGTTEIARFDNTAGAIGRFGIGTNSPSARLHVVSTTEQLRLGYDASNYYSTTVGSTGAVEFDAFGTGASFNFKDKVEVTDGTSTATFLDGTYAINVVGKSFFSNPYGSYGYIATPSYGACFGDPTNSVCFGDGFYAVNAIGNVLINGELTIGSTTITEAQLIDLLALI